MSYHFVVTGIGICIENITNHEEFIEYMITKKQTRRKKIKDALQYAIKMALKDVDDTPVLVLSEESISEEVIAEFKISEQKRCSDFAHMLETAGTIFEQDVWNNVLLISQNKEGCIAVLLSESAKRHLVQVEVEQESILTKEEIKRPVETKNSGVGKKFTSFVQTFTSKNSSKEVTISQGTVMDAMMEFVKDIIEVRFSMNFDGSGENEIYLWNWKEKRERIRSVDGIRLKVEEAKLVNRPVFESKRYLIPVMFDTVGEAKKKLLYLQKSAQEKGLFKTMQIFVEALKEKRSENTIVFLVEDVNSLKMQIEELLAKSHHLLEEGFYWKSKTGSLYIRHNIKNPKVVFMNPPGGMFNSKVFHRFVGKLYEFVDENSDYERESRVRKSENKSLDAYLSEIVITYIVMFLLETIGIKPNYLSGASMGELVFHFLTLELKNNANAETKELHNELGSLDVIMSRIVEEIDLQEERYFDHKINLAKYYLKFSAEKVKKAIQNYDDVFVIIEGSPKDVIICGEKKSCEKLFRQIGCIAKLLDDPTYVHTPVIEHEYENIRKELLSHEFHLNLKDSDFKIMSSYFGKYMDETCEMFAENFAAVITKPVDYTKTVEKLYEEGARIFIDISTTQLCGSWAKVTLEGKKDAQVISVYEEKETAEYLINLCAAMLAGNVAFDFDKIYSRIKFIKDVDVEEEDIQNESNEVLIEEKVVQTVESINPLSDHAVQVESISQQYPYRRDTMVIMNHENSCEILANKQYPVLFVYKQNEKLVVSTEELKNEKLIFQIPNITAQALGNDAFKKDYNVKYAYYGGAMANGIASADMVIALGKKGFMGSYGAGGCSIENLEKEIDKIQKALYNQEPYMINMLNNRNADMELELAKLLVKKNVPAVEASAYITISKALVYYRVQGLSEKNGKIQIPHKIIAKVSREEVLTKFVMPPEEKLVKELVKDGLLTEEEAILSRKISMADDITVEADSGGHTDGRPLVSMLPALLALANQLQEKYQYEKPVRIGAGGGIGTGLSCLGAFEMGASYVVTGSINQSCVEAGTSDYVKQCLEETAMADVTMAPCADMFETGAKVEVIKKKTMYPQNAQKLYEYYVKYASFEEIPEAERQKIEKRILKQSFEDIWESTKQYFETVDPKQIAKAEANPKAKMALVFRWYLGNSSRWAVQGDETRKTDMQIWCGQSMGAFNLWVKNTPLEHRENRYVAEVAELMMQSAAYQYMKNLCRQIGVSAEDMQEDILKSHFHHIK